MRVLADEIRNEEAKAIMLRLADDYDELGDWALDRTNAKLKKQNDGPPRLAAFFLIAVQTGY